MATFDILTKQATRSCMVDGRPGNFHLWEQFSTVVPPSPMVGGPPGGTVSSVYGIVEFSDGVKRVDPINIKFTDEDHIYLSEYEKWLSEKEKTNAEN